MAHSLPFVEWDARRKRFSVNEDAAAYLGTLDERIGSLSPVVAACCEV